MKHRFDEAVVQGPCVRLANVHADRPADPAVPPVVSHRGYVIVAGNRQAGLERGNCMVPGAVARGAAIPSSERMATRRFMHHPERPSRPFTPLKQVREPTPDIIG